MSKILNLLHQVNNLRSGHVSISLDEGQITVYEPFAKESSRYDDFSSRNNTPHQADNTSNYLLLALAVFGVFITIYTYIMTMDTRRHVAQIMHSLEDITHQQKTAHLTIAAMKDNLKNSTIDYSFRLNQVEQALDGLKAVSERNLNLMKNDLTREYTQLSKRIDALETKLTTIKEGKSLPWAK